MAGFFMLIAFAIAGLFLALIIGQLLTGLSNEEVVTAMNPRNASAANAGLFRTFHILNQVVAYFIPAFITAALLHRKPVSLLGYQPGFRLNQAGIVLLIMIMALVAASGLSYVNHLIPVPADWKLKFDQLEADYSRQVEAIVSLRTPGDFVVALLLMAVLPAICEETLFRGGLQNFLARATRNPVLSVVIVSLIFSAVHFSFYGFLSRFFLGVVLGCLYQYSGRMWPNILAHFLNNAAALTALYIYHRQGKSMSDAMTESEAGWWGLLFMVPLVALLVYFKRISAAQKQTAI